MRRLIIDIGNTYTKTAIFEGSEIIFSDKTENISKRYLQEFLSSKKDITSSIISAVKDYPLEIDNFLSAGFYHLVLSPEIKLPFNNKYKTPKTLGKDRVALVAGAVKRLPGENVLIIDAGTTITYDVVTCDKQYLGGAISPGIKMRFKALNNFTGKLPLIDDVEFVGLTGFDTKTSIQSGVMNGVVKEIDGIIDEYKGRFSNLKILLTGGDHIYFVKKVKNSIFAVPNLVLEGLNEILVFNEDN